MATKFIWRFRIGANILARRAYRAYKVKEYQVTVFKNRS